MVETIFKNFLRCEWDFKYKRFTVFSIFQSGNMNIFHSIMHISKAKNVITFLSPMNNCTRSWCQEEKRAWCILFASRYIERRRWQIMRRNYFKEYTYKKLKNYTLHDKTPILRVYNIHITQQMVGIYNESTNGRNKNPTAVLLVPKTKQRLFINFHLWEEYGSIRVCN